MVNKKVMKNKLISSFIFFLFFTAGLCAQQTVHYSQYMYTPSLINPAFAGLSDIFQVSLLHRSQWVGIPGAPTSQTLLVSFPFTDAVGMGFGVTRDQIGPANETNASIDFSYLLQLDGRGTKLSFGIKGGLQLLNVDFTKLNTSNQNDPSLDNINARYTPNFGAGIFLYNRNWYLGFSIPNLLSTKHYNSVSTSQVSSVLQTYFMGGLNFNINNEIQMKPALLIRAVKDAPLILDVSLNFLFNESITTGISYRYNAAISGLVKVKISESMSIGYAYDLDRSALSYFSGGSHEAILIFNLSVLIDRVQPSWVY